MKYKRKKKQLSKTLERIWFQLERTGLVRRCFLWLSSASTEAISSTPSLSLVAIRKYLSP